MKFCKIISGVLIIGVILSSITIIPPTKVLAADNAIYVTKKNNGQYVGTENSQKSLRGELLHGEIYSLEDGTLLIKTLPDVYEIVQKRTAKLSDSANINAIMNDTSISQDVKDDILKRSQQQAAINNISATVEVYTPVSSGTTTSSTIITPMSESSSYYTYVASNGRSYKMKDTLVSYANLESPECEYVKGINAGSISDGITSFLVDIAGTNTYVGIFTTGLSIFKNFLNTMGARTYYGAANDRAWFRVKYDLWTKWTFVDMTGSGGWATGAVTEMVNKRSIVWYEYFTTDIGGNSRTDTISYNRVFSSPNYTSPQALAVQWAGGPGWVENNISMRVNGTLFVY